MKGDFDHVFETDSDLTLNLRAKLSAAIPVVMNQIWVGVDKNKIYSVMGSLESRFISWDKNIKKIAFMFLSTRYLILVKNILI